jgi:hypothetical protein
MIALVAIVWIAVCAALLREVLILRGTRRRVEADGHRAMEFRGSVLKERRQRLADAGYGRRTG